MKFNNCPLCGQKPYVGPTSALSYGVRCLSCGIEINLFIPNRIRKSRSDNYQHRVLFKVWKKWQRLRAIDEV